jgi:dienelactone hydrolase
VRRLPLIVALAALLVACGGEQSAQPAKTPQADPFAYDASRPLRERSRVVDTIEGVEVRDVSFVAGGTRTNAYLITPDAKEPRPAVIFLHGAGGNREQMLPFAARWTAEGGVALTIEGAQVRNTTSAQQELRGQRDAAAQTVVRVRRAVDYLQSLDEVDDERIGLVGYSAGARMGAIVAGVEPRIDAFVLMSGGATPLQEYVDAAPEELRADVRRNLGAVDPLRWIARARPNTIFFQDGRDDAIVPRKALNDLHAAASKPQRLTWYDAGHDLNAKAYADQRAWLEARLGLSK